MTEPHPGFYKLTRDVKIPQPDRRKTREIWSLPYIPAGTIITLRKHFEGWDVGVKRGDYLIDGKNVFINDDERLHWRPNNEPRERGDNWHLGWELMDAAERASDDEAGKYRAAWMRATGDDPSSQFFNGAPSMLRRLFESGVVTERHLRQHAEGPPCPARSDTGFPCALSTNDGDPHDGEHDFS